MAQNTLIYGNAEEHGQPCDMLFTDPPYEMNGKTLATILDNYTTSHLVLITTMKQFIEFIENSDWKLNFDFVLDGVMPKKSKSLMQPNYTHQNGFYLTKNNAKSIFNRKLRQRSDVVESNGYWPTIFHAPRNNTQQHGMAKNTDTITDILGSFNVQNVCDPFAGSGSTLVAAWELDIKCTLVENDKKTFEYLKNLASFMDTYGIEIKE